MKNRIIFMLVISNVIFILLWSGVSTTASRQKKLAADKAAISMDLEDKNAKLEREKSMLAAEVKDIQAKWEEDKTILEAAQKELSQEQIAEQALKVELERVTRLKETLESDLKEALAAKKKIQ